MTGKIGIGEVLTHQVLTNPFGVQIIKRQVNIGQLISFAEFQELHDELKKHNFDLVLYREDGKIIAIEVNWKHKNKAVKKGEKFKQMLKKHNIDYATIDDYDCRSSLQGQSGLFSLTSHGDHTPTWNDLRDIIDAFEKAGIPPVPRQAFTIS